VRRHARSVVADVPDRCDHEHDKEYANEHRESPRLRRYGERDWERMDIRSEELADFIRYLTGFQHRDRQQDHSPRHEGST
jgi:hypothetical protein